MQLTPKLNLKKPDLTDSINVQDLNDNMDVLDTAVSELQEGSASIPDLETNDKTLAGAINEIKQTVNDVETNAQQQLKNHEVDYVKHPAYAGTTFASNVYSVTLDPPLTAYKDGVGLVLKLNATPSAGTIGINVDGLGNKSVYRAKGTSANASMFVKDGIYEFRYSATANNGNGAFILQGEGGAGNAQPSDVRTGKTFTNDDGEKTGTLVAYGVGETVKAKDLINRDYIQTNLKENTNGYFRWDSTQVATVNGVELGFAYRASTRDTSLYCWETRTGIMRYVKNVKYEYLGSMMVVGDKLYICYRDYDGVITGGIGIEMMNALSGLQLSVDRVPAVTGFENVRDTCVQVYGGTTSILIGAGYSNYEFIARFDINGKYVSVSANFYSYLYTNDYPYWMATVGDRIYVGSFKSVYWFSYGFVYGGKLAEAISPYTYGGVAPNNIGGLAVLTSGAISQYTPSLGVVTAVGVASNGTGLGSMGDYLAFYTDSSAIMYKMSADGKTAYYEASHAWSAGFKISSPARCLGFSENAFVLGSYDTFNVLPSVVTRTLKVIR